MAADACLEAQTASSIGEGDGGVTYDSIGITTTCEACCTLALSRTPSSTLAVSRPRYACAGQADTASEGR